MRRLLLLATVATVFVVGGWVLLRAFQEPSPASGEPTAATKAAEPVRLDASIDGDATAHVRFTAVLTERTLKWQLTNPAKLARASSLLVDTADQRVSLCTSCGAEEVGTVSLSFHAALAASTGLAELSVETQEGGFARSKVQAARCTCAAGLYFPPNSSSQWSSRPGA